MTAMLAVAMFILTQTTIPDTRWTLSYRGRSTNELMHDSRAKTLVSTQVPRRLSRDVYDALSGPPDPVLVFQDRYVSMSAAVPHFAVFRGFLWTDTKTGVALGGFFHNDTLSLGSNGLAVAGISGVARAAVVEWLTFQKLKPTHVEFIGRNGGSLPLDHAAFQPRVEYEPAHGGPSFDCAKASGTIETAICRDSALAASDLDLFNVVDQMKHGIATTGAQSQLAAMQRDWLSRRDKECATVPDVNACLASQYREQKKRLGQWIPKR